MTQLKFTKNELRAQEKRLTQLERYLPTLRLKKAMLQSEITDIRKQIARLSALYTTQKGEVDQFSSLFTAPSPIDVAEFVQIKNVEVSLENIAGVEVPNFIALHFEEKFYPLFDTPPWVDSALIALKGLLQIKSEEEVAKKKRAALEEELRQVSIRVNLFEKILIPRALRNIKTIKVFLGDQELAAVARAKVAKEKIKLHKAGVQ